MVGTNTQTSSDSEMVMESYKLQVDMWVGQTAGKGLPAPRRDEKAESGVFLSSL